MSSQRYRPDVILAAIDYSDISGLVVQEAVDLARQRSAGQLHFLHVNQAPPEDAGQEGRRHTYYDPRASSWVSQRMLP